MPKGMKPREFKEQTLSLIEAVDLAYTLIAPTGRGEIPIGLMLCALSGHRLQPHVLWFEWASPRNRIESVVNFINEMRRMWNIGIAAEETYWPFFNHVCRHGILQRIGKWFDYYADGDALLYQSRKPK